MTNFAPEMSKRNVSRRLGRAYPWLVMVVWAVACFAFFHLAYRYHFYQLEQNQLFLLSPDYVASYTGTGWLARLAGDFLTQFYYYLYAGPAILTLCLLAVGVLLFAALRAWRVRRGVALAAALAAMSLQAVFHWRHDFPLSATVTLLGWLLVAAGLSHVLAGLIRTRKSLSPVRAALSLLPWAVLAGLCAWSMGAPRWGRVGGPEWQVEQFLAVDTEYRFGHYDRVIRMVESEPAPTMEQKFYYNMVRASRGELPDYLLRYVPNELGTFYSIGPETPLHITKTMNELYWLLGDMTFTERAAMMANVFSPHNRNVRMVKRLAETSLVSGDSLAAAKYLRLLSQTVAYADWARQAPANAFYAGRSAFTNRQDTMAVSDNAHFIMMQLLDSNPDNIVALDYLLCSDLLLKDIANFKRDYDRYCSDRPRVKRLYQEALCVWLAGTGADEQLWQQLIADPAVAQRFALYNRRRGSDEFRDTYWYYFDKAKTPAP